MHVDGQDPGVCQVVLTGFAEQYYIAYMFERLVSCVGSQAWSQWLSRGDWCIWRAILWSLHIYEGLVSCVCYIVNMILVQWLLPQGEPALRSTRQRHASVFLSWGSVVLISILCTLLCLLETLLNWISFQKVHIDGILYFSQIYLLVHCWTEVDSPQLQDDMDQSHTTFNADGLHQSQTMLTGR